MTSHPDSPTTPRAFIAFRPYGEGVACVLFYFVQGPHVYGWWLGSRDSATHSAFFELEDFYTPGSTRFYATRGMDLHGGWRFVYSAHEPALDRPVIPDQVAAHELDRLQGVFAAEWLFFDDDPHANGEREAYVRAKLPMRHFNLRHRALARLTPAAHEMRYYSPEFDSRVLEYLQKYWPLDYRLGAREPPK